MMWKNKNVVVTGGASFIGSHLVDKLVELGSRVTVVDDLSSGKLENLSQSMTNIKFINKDLRYFDKREIVELFKDNEMVFHLAAVHGGRGYITKHKAEICSNLVIDHNVLEASKNAGVRKVIFASTACVYPPKLQNGYNSNYLLKESDCDLSDISKPLSADSEYGWFKLMGEIQLRTYVHQYGMEGCSLRFVTVYGPRENETHSIIALIYKCLERMDPFVIWGNGEQIRDFTYVSDIVDGTILAAEKINDGSAINLGTSQRYKVRDVAERILKIMDFHPKKISYDTSKPTGVINRSLDIDKAKQLLGWKPKVSIEEGIKKTIEEYTKTHFKKGEVDDKLLIER